MNTPAPRVLCVWLDTVLVGRLSEQGNIWRFDYDAEWENADLSPAIPRVLGSIIDGASRRPVQWFFSNLLPEEGARVLLARDARIDVADSFGLLQYYGRESAGALTLLPEGEGIAPGGLVPLTDEALSQRIRRLPQVPLSHDAPKRMSLAGAQHKLAVTVLVDGIHEPVGSEPSTHILKPDHPQPDHYWHTTINEWFVMRLASAGVSRSRCIWCAVLIERSARRPGDCRCWTLARCCRLMRSTSIARRARMRSTR